MSICFRMAIALPVFLIFSSTVVCHAAESLPGYVFESSKCSALPDMIVRLTAPRNSQRAQLITKTDQTGRFSFDYPKNGPVYIEVFQTTTQVYGHAINLDEEELPLFIIVTFVGAQKSSCLSRWSNFTQACPAPRFPSQELLAIDKVCRANGSLTAPSAIAQQNVAKNNFCATGGALPMTIAEMVDLQNRVAGKSPPIPARAGLMDRGAVKALGEGKIVVVRGFVLLARRIGPESVNCGSDVPNSPEFHDIRVSIVSSPYESDECKSISIELSPHHRPASWNLEKLDSVSHAKKLVRITGQLFFDSSHRPCGEGRASAMGPKRASVWEVHPVYDFEVCERDCDGRGKWVHLDKWTAKVEAIHY